MEKVKYLSADDLMCGYYLKRSEKFIKEYKKEKNVQDINDIISLNNIKKYFDNDIYLGEWTVDEIKHYKNIMKTSYRMIAKFFNSINENNFAIFYNNVDIDYKDNFWELVAKFKVYENISQEKFKEFITTSKVWLYQILKRKNMVEHFGRIIRDYMLNDYLSAELLLNQYEMKHNREKEPLYFPKDLNSADKETIICNYIDSEKPNLNYLRLITNVQSSTGRLELSPRTLLKSKKKVEEQERQFFYENSGMHCETLVAFSKTQDDEVVARINGQKNKITYSIKWIENNMDFATLLNNFIYLFEFVDLQMRCLFVNKFNRMSVFERFLVTISKNAYTTGIAFEQINMITLFQITGYYNVLFSIGIRLEEVIEWFFEDFIANEFDANNFKISMPSASSTFLEKCTIIAPAMESVLKQFSLFVKEGQVDYELLEIQSEHLIYKNIPSLVQKKYAYGIGNEFNKASFLLFSDQSGLGYNDKTKKSYNNFFKYMSKEKVKKKDFPDYCISQINWLIERQYLTIDETKHIIFKDKTNIMILRDLYYNEVISYWRYPESGRNVLNELEKKNVIEFESSLFSRPEQDYINYFLNKSKFNNGLDLRNKYSHTQPRSMANEKIHNQNYMIFLRLFIILVIKINDDFCISDEIEKDQD